MISNKTSKVTICIGGNNSFCQLPLIAKANDLDLRQSHIEPSIMKKQLTALCLVVLSLGIPVVSLAAEDPTFAAQTVNALGLDLLAKGTAANRNALLSPYSIQSALAMAYAGADGDTRTQMAKVLHYPQDERSLHQSFASLREALVQVVKASANEDTRKGSPGDPIVLTGANRLFGQQGYKFRQPFLDVVKDSYSAPLETMDFISNSEKERGKINDWVEKQTCKRICDLIPPGGLNRETRLVLVNAIYMKAPWAAPFDAKATKPLPFHVNGGDSLNVPTMFKQGYMGYAKREGYQVITVDYVGGDLQLLVLLPDKRNGLPTLEARLTPEILQSCTKLNARELELYMPKFKLEPPVCKLGKTLRSLGMTGAFDEPKGTANFDRMAPRKPDDYLCISEVFHKTFLALDEQGTEAAAATAVGMVNGACNSKFKSVVIEVRVDRPFLFAIQHCPSGACLFIGRVTDPR